MPNYTRAQYRDQIRFVLLFSAPLNIYYNWSAKDLANLSGVSQGDLNTQLGHLETVAPNSVVVVGATSPKPPTVKKTLLRNPNANQQGSVSTFCAPGNLNVALVNGWKLAKARRNSKAKKTARTVTALATISNEMIYASPMNAADHASYANELGLIDPATITGTNERNVIVTGASRPIAGHAFKVLPNGSTVSSYFSHDADILASNWVEDSPEIP